MTEVLEPTVESSLEEALDLAHIVYPNVEVGERALTLCGVEWKVTVAWADIPRDYPVCRGCVDVSLDMLSDANTIANEVLTYSALLVQDVTGMKDALLREDSAFFGVVTAGHKYLAAETERKLAKVMKKAAKREAKIEAAVAAAIEEYTPDRKNGVDDHTFRNACETRMLRERGKSWAEVAEAEDVSAEVLKAELKAAFKKK